MASEELPEVSPPATPSPLPIPPSTDPAPRPGESEPATTVSADEWQLWAGAAALLALLAGVVIFFVRRRRARAEPPEIERPSVAQAPTAPSITPTSVEALSVKAEAVSLTRSFVYATVQYRLSVTNRSTSAIENAAVEGDLVAAHNGKPVDQQVAGSDHSLEQRHLIERISPGQTITLEGTLQIPVAQIQPIQQGNLPLFVPLMRWRVTNGAGEAIAQTFVVGLRGQVSGGRLQPFRLDEQPQTYSQIGSRALG